MSTSQQTTRRPPFAVDPGRLLQATALLHTAVGLLIYREPLTELVSAGLFDQVVPHWDRAAAVWFLLFGAVVYSLGTLACWARQRTGELPASLAWGLIALAAAGVALMPVSGFWLVLAPAILILRGHLARPA